MRVDEVPVGALDRLDGRDDDLLELNPRDVRMRLATSIWARLTSVPKPCSSDCESENDRPESYAGFRK